MFYNKNKKNYFYALSIHKYLYNQFNYIAKKRKIHKKAASEFLVDNQFNRLN